MRQEDGGGFHGDEGRGRLDGDGGRAGSREERGRGSWRGAWLGARVAGGDRGGAAGELRERERDAYETENMGIRERERGGVG